MKKEKIAKFKKQVKENEIQRDKIRRLQKRVTIIGAIGLTCLVLMVLTGLFVEEKQSVDNEFILKTELSSKQIIETFLNSPPTITGEISEDIEITKNGAWIKSGDQKYFTLLAARFSTQEMIYTIKESNVDITGTWEINLTASEGGFKVQVKENSETKNIGYRSLLFWDSENRYCVNLFEALKLSLNN